MNVCTPNISWHGCDPVYSCTINPTDPKRLATAGMRGIKSFFIVQIWISQLGSIYVWDIEWPTAQQPTITFVSALAGAHLESVNCIRWNSKGTHLASASDDSSIFIWTKAPTITTDNVVTVLSKNTPSTGTTSTTTDSDNILGWDKDVPESKERWLKGLPYKGHLEPVLDLAWSRDDQLLISGSVDKKVIVVRHSSSLNRFTLDR